MSSWNDLLEETRRLIQERQAISLANGTDNGLMSQDDYSKLLTVQDGANRIVVDSTWSSDSVNPVSNSLIASRLNTMDQNIQTLNTQITQAEEELIGRNSVEKVREAINKLLDAVSISLTILTAHANYLAEYDCFNPWMKYLGDADRRAYDYCSGGGITVTHPITQDKWYTYWKGITITKPTGETCREDDNNTNNILIKLPTLLSSLNAGANYADIANQLQGYIPNIMQYIDFVGYVLGGYAGYGAPTGSEEKDLLNAWKTARRAYQVYMEAEPSLCWDGVWRK